MTDLLGLEIALTAARPIKMCPVARAIADFEGPVKTLAEIAVKDIDPDTGTYAWSAPQLVKLLNDKADLSLTASTMQRHRGGNCSCPRRKEN